MNNWNRETYATHDEVLFLMGLHERNPGAFAKYAALVTGGMRSYPETVDVQTVLTAIQKLGGERG
jgi:hypothetical protein